jgi:1-deoxy-D-xylulose-5-phosphate reductoisomerase
MTKIAILGSTGSIGRNCLEVISRSKNEWEVVGLSAGRNRELFRKQIEEFRPKILSLEREEDAAAFRREYPENSAEIFYGPEGAEAVARYSESDIVLSAITGISGLRPTLGAIQEGKRLALANKESLVVAGPIIMETAERTGSQIIPVDSEHSGVFQCLAKEDPGHVKKVILTASGGPFFRLSAEEMKNKTLDEALNHPRWKMGKKVTIDSATLMNKGLELIEARWLFDLEPGQLDMLIHPQSIVHSLVEMRDGSVLAQLSPTDMKIPIQYALTYPDREEALLPPLNLSQVGALEFYDIDEDKFPLVKLAREAMEEGGSAPVVLNSANEAAVEAFICGKILFSSIADIVTETVENHITRKIGGLAEIFDIDREIKEKTRNLIDKRE